MPNSSKQSSSESVSAKPKAATTQARATPAKKQKNQEETVQTGAASEHGSQTQTVTLTEQLHQQLPTLILTLRQKHEENLKGLSEKEQEEYILKNINAFRDTLLRNIDQFQAIVKSARPSAEAATQPDYQEQKALYCELLRVATGLVGNMKTTINELLTRYRLFIEDLWEAICNGKDPATITEKFQKDVEAYMKESWDPVFEKAEKMMKDIEKSRRS